MPERVLSLRELNRATLARQLLLGRADLPVLAALEQVAGLQAQVQNPPYIGLWSRLRGFEREQLTRLLAERQVVRATMLRGTLHLFTAPDYLRFRPTLQPALERAWRAFHGKDVIGLDVERVVATARYYFDQQPRSYTELGKLLLLHEPERDPAALAYTVMRTHLPIVQVYPGGSWAVGSTTSYAVAEDWLRQSLSVSDNLPDLIRRYLAAFGPATVADLQTWSGLSGLQAAVKALQPTLCTFRDQEGKQLFDLPAGPLPPADTPAPPRFLPDYDNLILAHSDRRRFVPDAHRKKVFLTAARVRATFLLDGFVAGTWRSERKKKEVRLLLEPFAPLSIADRHALAEEGERLLRFIADDASGFVVSFSD